MLMLLLSIYGLVLAFIYRPYEPVAEKAPHSDLVYYFGYGSNMSSRYLINIRNVPIYESQAASVKDHEVVFAVSSLPAVEPSFASMVPSPGRAAQGVVHLIDRANLRRIVGSESSSYRLREVDAVGSGDKPLKVWALLGSRGPATATPSQRYLDILIEGAEEHSLAEEYVAELKALDGMHMPLLSEAFGALVYLAVLSRSYDIL